jgi:hypothetical protein
MGKQKKKNQKSKKSKKSKKGQKGKGIGTLASTVIGAAVDAGLEARKNPSRYRSSKSPATYTRVIKGRDGKLKKFVYTIRSSVPTIGW